MAEVAVCEELCPDRTIEVVNTRLVFQPSELWPGLSVGEEDCSDMLWRWARGKRGNLLAEQFVRGKVFF